MVVVFCSSFIATSSCLFVSFGAETICSTTTVSLLIILMFLCCVVITRGSFSFSFSSGVCSVAAFFVLLANLAAFLSALLFSLFVSLVFSFMYSSGLFIVTKIESVTKGVIKDITVLDGGEGYKVGDLTVFDNTDTNGSGFSAKVDEIVGIGVSRIDTTLL